MASAISTIIVNSIGEIEDDAQLRDDAEERYDGRRQYEKISLGAPAPAIARPGTTGSGNDRQPIASVPQKITMLE